MYVLQPREPECQLRNELIHTYDEAVRLDGFLAIVQTEHARTHLIKRRGFKDITDQMLDRRGAAEELGVAIPNVDFWVRKGLLKCYGTGTAALFTPADVQAFKVKRGENA